MLLFLFSLAPSAESSIVNAMGVGFYVEKQTHNLIVEMINISTVLVTYPCLTVYLSAFLCAHVSLVTL